MIELHIADDNLDSVPFSCLTSTSMSVTSSRGKTTLPVRESLPYSAPAMRLVTGKAGGD